MSKQEINAELDRTQEQYKRFKKIADDAIEGMRKANIRLAQLADKLLEAMDNDRETV